MLAACAACGDDADGSGTGAGATTSASSGTAGDCQQPGRDYSLTEKEVTHSCGHLTDGPFDDVAAGEPLDNLHLLYTVTLDAAGDGTFAGTLTYTPRKTATHMVYSFSGAPITYEDASGARCVATSVSGVSCASAARVDFVDLEEGVPVNFTISAPTETIQLLLERK